MVTPFFARGPIQDFDSAKVADTTRFATFFHALLSRGIAWPPAQLEAGFISMAHDERDVAQALAAAEDAFREVART
jgi:glutamate-1-semialdehyde 2,1-aminomutase